VEKFIGIHWMGDVIEPSWKGPKPTVALSNPMMGYLFSLYSFCKCGHNRKDSRTYQCLYARPKYVLVLWYSYAAQTFRSDAPSESRFWRFRVVWRGVVRRRGPMIDEVN